MTNPAEWRGNCLYCQRINGSITVKFVPSADPLIQHAYTKCERCGATGGLFVSVQTVIAKHESILARLASKDTNKVSVSNNAEKPLTAREMVAAMLFSGFSIYNNERRAEKALEMADEFLKVARGEG